MVIIGSVTRIDAGSLRPDVLLCGGEEPTELLAALGVSPQLPPSFDYRCIKAWVINEVTVIRAGMGSGEVGSVVHELLALPEIEEVDRPQFRPHRLILVGTAGRLNKASARVQLGDAHPIGAADGSTTALCALPWFKADELLAPRWPDLNPSQLRTIASTDYFYDFAPTGKLRAAWEAAASRLDLVDMEVAHFYHHCRGMAASLGLSDLSYLAIKGAANDASLEGFKEQNSWSESVLREACHQAMELFGASHS